MQVFQLQQEVTRPKAKFELASTEVFFRLNELRSENYLNDKVGTVIS